MNKPKIVLKTGAALSKAALKTRAHLPGILFASGMILGTAALVTMAVKASKLKENTEPEIKNLEEVHLRKSTIGSPSYGRGDYIKDLGIAYSKITMSCVKVLALPIGLGATAGILLILGANRGRKMYISASAAALGYANLLASDRKKFAQVIGEDNEHIIHQGLVEKEVAIVNEDGEKKIAEVRKVWCPPEIGPGYFSFRWDEGCGMFDPNAIRSTAAKQINVQRLVSIWTALKERNQLRHITAAEVMDAFEFHDPKLRNDPRALHWGYPQGYCGFDFGIFKIREDGTVELRPFANGEYPYIQLDFSDMIDLYPLMYREMELYEKKQGK